MEAAHHPRHVSLIATPEVMAGTLAGLNDVLNCFGALDWFDESLERHPPYQVEIVSEHATTVALGGGLALPWVRGVREVRQTDLIIVPSLMVAAGQWQKDRYPVLVDWIADMHAAGAELYSACSGTLLLAETGLLDGRKAAMHWAYAETFRRNFPAVKLQLDKALVTEGERNELVMSGAASSWHDLVLYLIARHLGTPAAQAVAKFFALEFHRDGMAPYNVFVPNRDHGDATIQRAQWWVAEHLDTPCPVQGMAEVCAISERSFKRRFRKATGYTPIDYVQELRLSRARQLLEQTRQAIDDIAEDVGYENPAYFRKLFKRKVGITPGAYRRKFNVPAEPQ